MARTACVRFVEVDDQHKCQSINQDGCGVGTLHAVADRQTAAETVCVICDGWMMEGHSMHACMHYEFTKNTKSSISWCSLAVAFLIFY